MKSCGRALGNSVVVICLIFCCSCREDGNEPADSITLDSSSVDVGIEFQAEWWSEEQMANFDPNDPPPKETTIILERWEPFDPVEDPHPDIFDIVVTIRNASARRLEGLRLTAYSRWSIGPLEDKKSAVWQEEEMTSSVTLGPIDPSEKRAVNVAQINIAALQLELYENYRWPWLFEMRAVLYEPDANKVLAESVKQLPVRAGD